MAAITAEAYQKVKVHTSYCTKWIGFKMHAWLNKKRNMWYF